MVDRWLSRLDIVDTLSSTTEINGEYIILAIRSMTRNNFGADTD